LPPISTGSRLSMPAAQKNRLGRPACWRRAASSTDGRRQQAWRSRGGRKAFSPARATLAAGMFASCLLSVLEFPLKLLQSARGRRDAGDSD